MQFRWMVYITTAWAFEYSTGWLLREFTGHCPWVRNSYLRLPGFINSEFLTDSAKRCLLSRITLKPLTIFMA